MHLLEQAGAGSEWKGTLGWNLYLWLEEGQTGAGVGLGLAGGGGAGGDDYSRCGKDEKCRVRKPPGGAENVYWLGKPGLSCCPWANRLWTWVSTLTAPTVLLRTIWMTVAPANIHILSTCNMTGCCGLNTAWQRSPEATTWSPVWQCCLDGTLKRWSLMGGK